MSSQSLSNKWISLFINGVIAAIFGTVFVFVPKAVYVTIIQVLGVLFLVAGGGFIFSAIRRGTDGGLHIMAIIQGLVNIGVGIFMLLQPKLVFDFTMTFIAIWLIVSGGMQLYDSHSMRNVMNHYRILMVWGFLNIALGVIIILFPKLLVNLFGIIFYAIAVVMFIYAAIFFGYRNHIPGKPELEVEDAEVVDIEETK
jgi:uncharacterized membrane protein HdeD (DUF308 family)